MLIAALGIACRRPLDPWQFVPERYRPEPPKPDPEREKVESEIAWKLFEAGLKFGR